MLDTIAVTPPASSPVVMVVSVPVELHCTASVVPASWPLTVTCAVPATSVPGRRLVLRRPRRATRQRECGRGAGEAGEFSQCRIYGVAPPNTVRLQDSSAPFFSVDAELPGRPGRAGVIRTAHGDIHTPAFIPVGTQATVKAVLPETMRSLGAQAILANAYHLYLQPGPDIVAEAGGLGAFMNWPGPTFTDSGGFQVLSLGAGFRKVLAMDTERVQADDIIAEGKERLANVDDDGVTFRSHLDGSTHRFTPEGSIRIQHQLGADIIFAFDELTTLVNTRGYQEQSVQRTHDWAVRCVVEHRQSHRCDARSAHAGPVRCRAGRAVRGSAPSCRARADVDRR